MAPAPPAVHSPVGAIYKIARNLYIVPGGGGNTAVFVTAAGVLLVDTKYEDRYDAMIEQVRTVTDKPITHVINTHCHGDHTAGNRFLPAGTEIVVQERTAANLEKMRREHTAAPATAASIRTYRDRLTLFSGDEAVDLYYFGPAHTDGDTFVVFRAAGVMHAGDVFAGKTFPIINIEWGGDGVAFSDTLDRAIAGVSNVHQVVTGHGPVMTWDDFVAYRDFNRFVLDYVRNGMKSGGDKNLVFNALPLPDRFHDYNRDRAFATMDEIDRSIRPRWRRVLPPFLSRYL